MKLPWSLSSSYSCLPLITTALDSRAAGISKDNAKEVRRVKNDDAGRFW
jgi:hypothetical protein